MFLSYKHNFNKRAIQVQGQFRFAFFQHPPPIKIAIPKNVLKYQKDVTCLNLNKTKSGTRTTVRTVDNITVAQQSLEMMKVSWMQQKRKVHLKRSHNSSNLRRVWAKYQHLTCITGT